MTYEQAVEYYEQHPEVWEQFAETYGFPMKPQVFFDSFISFAELAKANELEA